ncbi:TetR family transcriptional regulator [Murinocardiopsis flavida]|uniref:TetR family transcriptional regulator n=1 Tax=Murinocardiopsis flavida TaxID=645275 RepID=A0A2P8CZY1_9ACTN|nr:TetR/AcrR family transcriptional regulator [Murinocardiopsis flavida]PSK90512.1 TetR family transcriptional regulator [Murinocardiopsis flavida]
MTETSAAPTGTRAPGRPRSREAGAAILAAALELLAERRYIAKISVAAIAARAGVGKATIYRRWAAKEELFTDAVATLRPPLPALAGVSVRDDLVDLLAQVCAEGDSPLDRALGVLMLNDDHLELVVRIKRTVFGPRDEQMRAVLRRGARTGELRPGFPPQTVRHLLVGGALMARRSEGTRPPRDCAAELVDTLLDGLCAAPAADPG